MDDHGSAVSATGGSAATQAVDANARRWRTRRGTALGIRALVVLLPFVASLIVGRSLATVMPRPSGPLPTLTWWAAIIIGSTLALVGVDRIARRLLPVALLYRLALVFPDRAPSRYRVALRTGTVHQLRERLERGGDLGATPSEAAENLLALVAALGKHDRITRGHSERVRAYSDIIAVEMGIPEADRERLHWAALVHDVGKMAVRPEVLNKPGRPNDEEWQELRNHPAAAAVMVEPLRPWLGDWVDSATQHHERIDGKGYPGGLTGQEITLAGRIVAVADAYDCMTSARSYKKALPAEQARYELTRNSGTQFDADVVRALLGVSVGRLHLAGGPLSWLAQVPGAREAITVSGTGGGASVSAGFAAAAVTVAGAVGGLVAPPTSADPVSAARIAAPVEHVVVDRTVAPATSRPLVTAADGTTPTTTAAPVDPFAPTTAPPAGQGTTTTTTITAAPRGGTGAPPTTAAGAPSPGGGSPTVTTTRAPSSPAAPAVTTTTRAPAAPTTTAAAMVPTTTAPPAPIPTTTAPPVNSPPNAVNDSASVATGSQTDFFVLQNDSDSNGLNANSLSIVQHPNFGAAEVKSNGRIRYNAPGLALGTPVTVRYRICDNLGACSEANLNITVKLLGLL